MKLRVLEALIFNLTAFVLRLLLVDVVLAITEKFRNRVEYKAGGDLSDLGGLREAKKVMKRIFVVPCQNKHVFFPPKFPELKVINTILLYGPSGTGKTSLVTCSAKEAGCEVVPISASSTFSKWVGESEKNLKAAFERCKKSKVPIVLFVDEIDSFGRNRSETEDNHFYSFKCEFIRQMDDLFENRHVFCIACTNNVSYLDVAIRRRFKYELKVDVPDEEERVDIMKKLLMKTESSMPSENEIKKICYKMDNMTPASIQIQHEKVCSKRMERYLKTGKLYPLTHKHFLQIS
jgi:SpoVK/Ycf46/Vps4 family AAA+-type ATPase